MSIPHKYGRIAVKEQSSGYGTPESVFANANFLKAMVSSPPSPVLDSEAIEVIQPDVYAPTRIAGGQGVVEFSLSGPMVGHSTATPSGEATEHPLALLLRSVLGAVEQDGYHASDITSGGTVSLVALTANAADAEVGHAILVPLASGHSVGWIKTGDTAADTYVPIVDLSAAPASAGAILGANTIYASTTQPTPFTIQYLGSTGNLALRYSDAAASQMVLTFETGKPPTFDATIRAITHTNDGSGGAPADAALTDRPEMPACLNSNGFRVVDTFAEQKASKVVITITQELAVLMDSSVANGKGRFCMTSRRVEVEVTAAALASGGSTVNDPADPPEPGDTAQALQIDANTTPGRAFSFLLPAAVPVSSAPFEVDGDAIAIRTTYEGTQYTSDSSTGAVTVPANTSARAAFL